LFDRARSSLPGGANEIEMEYDAATTSEIVSAHAARGTQFVYLGTRHDAQAAACALAMPRAAALRFAPVLARSACGAAAEAVRAAVWRTGRVAFSEDRRLFACPTRAHAWAQRHAPPQRRGAAAAAAPAVHDDDDDDEDDDDFE
jgi:hypothetical protein